MLSELLFVTIRNLPVGSTMGKPVPCPMVTLGAPVDVSTPVVGSILKITSEPSPAIGLVRTNRKFFVGWNDAISAGAPTLNGEPGTAVNSPVLALIANTATDPAPVPMFMTSRNFPDG